jgi:ABC-type spermidine/putrescine transport system permease subunit II
MGKSVFEHRWPMYWSAAIGFATAAVVVIAALGLAWLAIRRRWFARWVFMPLAAMSLTLPYPVVGIWVDSMFSRIKLESFQQLWDRTIFGPVVAIAWIAFGPVAIMLYFALRQTSKSVLESMTTERAGGVVLFWNLGVSANRVAIVAGFGAAFLISIGDVAASFQVLPAGIDTVARSILGQLHSGVDDRTAAVSLTMLLASVAFSWIIVRAVRKHGIWVSSKN